MRRLLYAISLLALLYMGWWGLTYAGLTRGLDAAEEAAATRGFDITYAARSTSGFPSRLDTTWEDLTVEGNGFTYSVPEAQMIALTYRPDRAIIVAPGPHLFRMGDTELGLTTGDSRGSVRVVPGLDLALNRATVESRDTALFINGLEIARARHGLTALRRAGEDGHLIDLYALFEDITPLAAPGPLPETINSFEVDGQLALSAPFAFRQSPARVERIDLTHMTLHWGPSTLVISAKLTADSTGVLSGDLEINGDGWEKVLESAVAAGVLAPTVALTWRSLGAEVSQDDGTLVLPLVVQDGRVMMGFVPIALLPPLPGY